MKKIVFLSIFLINCFLAQAQFYNGHEMDFGKNRVQYQDFFWQYYRFDKFDTYFYMQGKELAAITSSIVEGKITEIEGLFDYALDKRIIFIVYNRQTDFKQSNIGLSTGSEENNIGGVNKIIDNKVFLFYTGDLQSYENQITAAIVEVVFNEMFYSGNLREKMANSAMLNLPEWFTEGLISYYSNYWDTNIDNHVRDGVISGRYKKFNRLSGEDAVYAGHSIWKYIADVYGEELIPTIIYLTRINKNPDNGFLYVLGYSIKELSYGWLDYYLTKYNGDVENCVSNTSEPLILKPKKNTVYQNYKQSPDGRYVAYTTNISGKYKIWLYDITADKLKNIYTRENKLEQIVDNTYPVLAWHPSSKYLTYMTEEKGQLMLSTYTVETKELVQRPMLFFEKVMDYSYSHDGAYIAISGVYRGQNDLYVHKVSANSNQRITNDLADELNPRFIENSTKIVFSSNRLNDTIIQTGNNLIPLSETFDLFIYDFEHRSPVLSRLTNTPFITETMPFELKHNKFMYLTDKNGIINREIAIFDSVISFIDTTTHYRYFSKTYQTTNYDRNIIEHDINTENGKLSEIIFKNGKYFLYQSEFDENQVATEPTEYRIFLDKMYQDAILKAQKEAQEAKEAELLVKQISPEIKIENPDSILIDINRYVFERERNPYNYTLLSDSLEIVEETQERFALPTPRVYKTAFYPNFFVNQVDFSFLEATYQQFTGDVFYFNPGFNLMFKVGASDLFEDYRLIVGTRLSYDFSSNEYLISIEDLKRQIDKQYIFHRQGITEVDNYTGGVDKIFTHQLMYIMKYPFNQVFTVKGTTGIRHDHLVHKSTDQNSLLSENQQTVRVNLKAELIFDNTRSLGVNLFDGTRFKVFGEFYNQLDSLKSDLFVVGFDFRHYYPIHRNIIWASRLAASSSFGHSLLIYYLGGVDNWWYNVTPSVDPFDNDIPIDEEKNYVYQTVATNMRGFSQNIRNGNNFFVLNNEIRVPLFQYIANRPLSSDFLNNFQIVGFVDAGSAWTGISPFSKESAYHIENVTTGGANITIIIDKNRSPIVWGYGFGIHSRLFGYYVRADWAWGVDKMVVMPKMFYLSLNLDF